MDSVNNTDKKMKNKSGFTLGELLVVVAIIGVLVAVSIPFFPLLTEYSKERSDANYEAAARVGYMAASSNNEISTSSIQYYDEENSTFSTYKADIKTGYGLGTSIGNVKENHAGRIIACSYVNDEIVISWTTLSLNPSENPISLFYSDEEKKRYSSITGSTNNNASMNSINTADANAQAIQADLEKLFPNTNIAFWRITNESSTMTVLITDVDITTLNDGDYVKVIRYNPNYNNTKTYTAAYIKVTHSGNSWDIQEDSKMTYYHQVALGSTVQTNTTKASYETTINTFFNHMPDVITAAQVKSLKLDTTGKAVWTIKV